MGAASLVMVATVLMTMMTISRLVLPPCVGVPLNVRVWGTRGSIPTPGARTVRYGGNTPCLEVRTESDWLVILDAGTGIRELGQHLLDATPAPRWHALRFRR